jgi:PAS domain S-box-containing protein
MKTVERPWLWLLAVGVAAGAAAFAVVLTSDHAGDQVSFGVLGLLLGWSFIGSGVFAWARRPDNRTGALMVAVGFAWFLGSLSYANSSVLYTLGNAMGALALAVYIHLLFAFPSGHVEGVRERAIVAAAYPTALLANLTSLVVDSTPDDNCKNCPANALLVVDRHTAAEALQVFWNLVGLAFMVAAVIVLARRWRAATGPARRVLTPVYVGGLASVILVGLSFALDPVASSASGVLGFIGVMAFISVPFLFLAGLLRTRLARTGAVQLLQETPETTSLEETQTGLRRALNDPTLRLLVRDEDGPGYLDIDGRAVDLPEESDREAVTRLTNEGRPIAAVVLDPALRGEPELLHDVLAAARLALVKERSLHALELSERRNRALLDAIPDNMFRIRGDGMYVDFHSNRPDALSLPPERIVGSHITEHLPPDEAGVRMEAIRRVIATGRAETFELRVAEPSGRVSDREVRMVKSGDDEVLAITRDITDRKRAEQEVLHQRDFLRTVVNTAQSIFCVVTTDGRIVRFDDFCARLTGRVDDERARGRFFWELFAAPEDADAVREAFDADVPGHEYEHRWITVSGERVLVAWSITPLVDETGEERRLVHGVDVTEQKRQQEELKRSRARIVEAESAERRRLERNLHDGAQQRLVSLSLSLRLAQAKLASDPDGTAEILRGTSAELATALEELRELARGIHPAVLSDRGLVPALEALADRAPLPVELDTVPEERLPAYVETAAFYVVSEALTNVAKYAEASFARVSVTREDGHAFVEVADNGKGGADKAHGTGLRGLADRVEALDGDLCVDSPPGAGTTVRAVIPIGAAEPARLPASQSAR